ncbi:hypothetical protein D3C81_1652680 [compost metagenome]
MICSSSSECASSCSEAGLTPNRRTSWLADPFKAQMKGRITFVNRIKGLAVRIAISSALRIATVLGASSPTTTWKYVMTTNAIIKESALPTVSGTSRRWNNGCSMLSTVGSPSHPSPSAVIVIPSWQADRNPSRLEVTCLTARAPLRPSAIN